MRTEIVRKRAEELSALSDKELVNLIVSYFRENRTMPGEKEFKDTATLLFEDLTRCEKPLTAAARKELIEGFASLCVKEVKLAKVRVKPENEPDDTELDWIPGYRVLKASDLPMVLVDVKPAQMNATKNTYSIIAETRQGPDGRVAVYLPQAERGGYYFCQIPKGFMANHKGLDKMAAVVLATDHSNNRFTNMSYTMIVDLAQHLAA